MPTTFSLAPRLPLGCRTTPCRLLWRPSERHQMSSFSCESEVSSSGRQALSPAPARPEPKRLRSVVVVLCLQICLKQMLVYCVLRMVSCVAAGAPIVISSSHFRVRTSGALSPPMGGNVRSLPHTAACQAAAQRSVGPSHTGAPPVVIQSGVSRLPEGAPSRAVRHGAGLSCSSRSRLGAIGRAPA